MPAMHMGRAEEIGVTGDEEGFELHITTDTGIKYIFNIHGVAEDLLVGVKAEVDPYLAEKAAAYRDRPFPNDDIEKHSLHVDYYDLRDKTC